MDRRHAAPPLRSLPRVFVPGADPESERFELPREELDKLRKVLRLGSGDLVALLPNDGSLVRCRLDGLQLVAEERLWPQTESPRHVSLLLGLAKPEALEDSLRMATEMGVAEIVVFPSERSVVRWGAERAEKRLVRLKTIVREAAELSYRIRLPALSMQSSLGAVLESYPEALVLSESEGLDRTLGEAVVGEEKFALMIGPEGGWSGRELELIGARAVTLGPRVLRVCSAVAAACAIALLNRPGDPSS